MGNPWIDHEECNYTLYDPDSYNNVSAWASDASALYYMDNETVAWLMRERWDELRSKGIISKEKYVKYLMNSLAICMLPGHMNEITIDGRAEQSTGRTTIYEYVNKRIDFLDQYFDQLYEDVTSPQVYNGIDYSEEFDARYYWEENRNTLKELYSYDAGTLLEHYVLYGKPFGLKGTYDGGEFPEVFEESDDAG